LSADIRNGCNPCALHEQLPDDYFSSAHPEQPGLPTVKYFADRMHFSANYLSDLPDAQNLLHQTRDQYTEAATGYFMKLSEYGKATGK
jgi:hypothetical protein